MNAKDAILLTLDNSDFILKSYVNDLADADLLQRPVEGMNNMAWQLGHLVSAERFFMEAVKPGASPELPDHFKDRYSKEDIGLDDPAKFLSKDQYVALWDAQRAATKAVLGAIPDADLDKPSPPDFQAYAPTIGAVFNMCGVHALMHVGQFVAVRRQLKKPISI